MDRTVIVNNNNFSHTSFNGGPGGIQAHPSPQEQQWSHEKHFAPTAEQQSHVQAAHANHANFASANGGHPVNAAFSRPGSTAGAVRSVGAPASRDGFGHANEVNTRQGNQQSRINNGVRFGATDAGRDAEPGESRLQHQSPGAGRPCGERRTPDRAGEDANQPAAEQREQLDQPATITTPITTRQPRHGTAPRRTRRSSRRSTWRRRTRRTRPRTIPGSSCSCLVVGC